MLQHLVLLRPNTGSHIAGRGGKASRNMIVTTSPRSRENTEAQRGGKGLSKATQSYRDKSEWFLEVQSPPPFFFLPLNKTEPPCLGLLLPLSAQSHSE